MQIFFTEDDNYGRQSTTRKKNKYEKMCFVIMPISDKEGYDKGHFTKIYEQIFKPAIENAGYEAYRVDENKISDAIIVKIFEAIQNAPMALCDLSSNNPNVLYELGLRQAYDKPVVLVKDDETDHIFDIGGISTIEYNKLRLYEHVEKAKEEITQAIKDTKSNKSKYSLINMVKANKAIMNNTSMEGDDTNQFMLMKILKAIDNLDKKDMNSFNDHMIVWNIRIINITKENHLNIENEIQTFSKAVKCNIIEETLDSILLKVSSRDIDDKRKVNIFKDRIEKMGATVEFI